MRHVTQKRVAGSPEGKRLLWRSGRRWKCKNKIGYKEILWAGINWFKLVHNEGVLEHGYGKSDFINAVKYLII